MLVCIIETQLCYVHPFSVDTTFLGRLVSRIDLGGVEPKKSGRNEYNPLNPPTKKKKDGSFCE